MKKHIASLAISMFLVAPVFAQSSVTLYGIIDEGFDFTNNVGGARDYQLTSGYASGSRWGLKGTEDLGNGLKALFVLENGFNVNNGKLGQGGLEFGRQGFVGIAQDQWGTATLGRQYDSVIDYIGPLTANGSWAGYLFSHPFDNDNTDNSFRVNNSVKYTSPNLGGFKFGGLYGFSNSTSFAVNKLLSLGAQYNYGGLQVAAAYMDATNPSSAENQNGAVFGTNFDANFLADRLRVFGGGVNYTFGSAKVGFVYTNTNLTSPSKTTTISGSIVPTGGVVNSLKFQNFEVNGKYQFTPAFFVGAEYVFTAESFDASTGQAKPRIQTAGLMADYFFSKRTDVYIQGVYQKVGGDKTGTALDYAYIQGAANSSSTAAQVVVRAAIRHRF